MPQLAMSDQGLQFACRNINLHLTNISLESNFPTYADSVVPERTPQLAASDQGLHSLLAEISTLLTVQYLGAGKQYRHRADATDSGI